MVANQYAQKSHTIFNGSFSCKLKYPQVSLQLALKRKHFFDEENSIEKPLQRLLLTWAATIKHHCSLSKDNHFRSHLRLFSQVLTRTELC